MFGGSSDEEVPDIPSLDAGQMIGVSRSDSNGGQRRGASPPSHTLAAESSSIGRGSPARERRSPSARTPRGGSKLKQATPASRASGGITTGKLMEVDKQVHVADDPPPPFEVNDPMAAQGMQWRHQ